MVDGVITALNNYATLLSKFADVTVFVPTARDKKYVDDRPYEVVRCSRIKLSMLDYDLPVPTLDSEFMKELKKRKLDIIHIHSPFTLGKTGAAFAKKNKIPAIITLHSQFKQDFYKATKSKTLTKILLANIMKTFNACDKIFTMNPACVELAREYGAKVPIEIVPNGTDFKLPEFKGDFKKEIREKYNVKDDEKLLLYVGRINTLKNIEFIINSLEILKQKNFKFKMLFVGSGADQEQFEKMVKEKNLTDCITFTGKIMDRELLCKVYASGDLFVFPSFYDTDGIVKIEAAACNVPTIFVEGSIASSCCEDKVNGYIGANDINKFADKIVEIFEDKETYEKVKVKCYEDLYITWNQVMEIVYKKYLETIEEKKKEIELKEKNSKTARKARKKQVTKRAKNIAKLSKNQDK